MVTQPRPLLRKKRLRQRRQAGTLSCSLGVVTGFLVHDMLFHFVSVLVPGGYCAWRRVWCGRRCPPFLCAFEEFVRFLDRSPCFCSATCCADVVCPLGLRLFRPPPGAASHVRRCLQTWRPSWQQAPPRTPSGSSSSSRARGRRPRGRRAPGRRSSAACCRRACRSSGVRRSRVATGGGRPARGARSVSVPVKSGKQAPTTAPPPPRLCCCPPSHARGGGGGGASDAISVTPTGAWSDPTTAVRTQAASRRVAKDGVAST